MTLDDKHGKKKKVAVFHRYGPSGHMECGGHFLDAAVDEWTRRDIEVHHYGYRSYGAGVVPPEALKVHCLPFLFRRCSDGDKLVKTLLWYLFLPFLCLSARLRGIRYVFVDETLPLTSWCYAVFFGRGTMMTVADFFLRIYAERHPWLCWLDGFITRLDAMGWMCLGTILTKTESAKRYLIALGIKDERIHTIYNSCDTERFHPTDRNAARKRFDISLSAFVFVHHGVLHPNKGNDRIIHGLSVLKEYIPGVVFLLVGSGPEMANLERLVHELGLQDHVKFTGWLAGEDDVNEALNTADVGLVMRIGQTSDHFHVTDTLTHEMAAGLPILAARLDGIAEIIEEGRSGYLFSPDCETDWTSKLLMYYREPAIRERFGATSRALAAKLFDVRKIGCEIATLGVPLSMTRHGKVRWRIG